MLKIILIIILSTNIFFTSANASDEASQVVNEIIENKGQDTKVTNAFGQEELRKTNENNISSPEYTGVLQSGKLHYGVGVAYEIRQKLAKLACGLTLPQFEFLVSDAATKLTKKSLNDAALRLLAEDIVTTGVGAKYSNSIQTNRNGPIAIFKQNVTTNLLQSVNSGSVRLINQGVLKAAMSLDRPYSCRNRIATDYFQSIAEEMKSKNMEAYQKFLQLFKFNCSYCDDQFSASVKLAQLQTIQAQKVNNTDAMKDMVTMVIPASLLFKGNIPLSLGIFAFGGTGVAAQWVKKGVDISNIEAANKELAKAQYDMCKTGCSDTLDAQAAKISKDKYNHGLNTVSKEFNSTNRLQDSEKPEAIGKQKFTKQEEDKIKTYNPVDDTGPENLDNKLSENVCKSVLDKGWGDPSYLTYEAYTKNLSVEINNSIESATTRIRGFLRNNPRIQFDKVEYSDSQLSELADNIEERRDDILAHANFTPDPFTSLDDYVARMLKFSNGKRMAMEIKWLRNNQEVFCR